MIALLLVAVLASASDSPTHEVAPDAGVAKRYPRELGFSAPDERALLAAVRPLPFGGLLLLIGAARSEGGGVFAAIQFRSEITAESRPMTRGEVLAVAAAFIEAAAEALPELERLDVSGVLPAPGEPPESRIRNVVFSVSCGRAALRRVRAVGPVSARAIERDFGRIFVPRESDATQPAVEPTDVHPPPRPTATPYVFPSGS